MPGMRDRNRRYDFAAIELRPVSGLSGSCPPSNLASPVLPGDRSVPTATDPQACPYCQSTDGVQTVTGTSPMVQAWWCTACETNWAITTTRPQRPAYFEQLVATVEEVGRLRWLLRQIMVLADTAPALTDEQLRSGARGLPVTARVTGDALTVLHTVVSDWPPN